MGERTKPEQEVGVATSAVQRGGGAQAMVSAAQVIPPRPTSEPAWRNKKLNQESLAHNRAQLEDSMLEMAEQWKQTANSILTTTRKDNQRLAEMSDATDKSLDKVTAQTQKGKKMLRS